MPQLKSVYIRPHLIPFLYNELQGDREANYLNKKSKLVKITQISPLGQLITLLMARAKVKMISPNSGFRIFFSLDTDDAKNNTAQFYEYTHYRTKSLSLLPKDSKLLNDHLEGIFRTNLVQYIKGYIKDRMSYSNVKSAIHNFMLEHNLYDTEIDPEALRRVYYSAIKKNFLLNRFQNPISSQVKNYKVA